MVQFNHNVKVLGYYLSDEERALKRQWSQENHERMVEVKKQLRRNRLIQQKINAPHQSQQTGYNQPQVRISSPYSSASVTPKPFEFEIDKRIIGLGTSESIHTNMQNYSGLMGSGPSCRSIGVSLNPSSPKVGRYNKVFSIESAQVDCEKITGAILAMVTTTITKFQQLSSFIEKEDPNALTSLTHLLIPELPVE